MDHTATPKLSIVIPVYRSEECVIALYDAIKRVLEDSRESFELVLVNDFSPDKSWDEIAALCAVDKRVIGIDLRKNFGQDNAILTGMRFARGQYVAVMDDDLQHDPKYLPALLTEIETGADIVYANFRTKQQRHWKNAGSWLNGKIAELVLGKPKAIYLSPYKIIRSDVAKLICRYSGNAAYVDGLLLQVTARISQISVEHQTRYSGKGNYHFWKSVGVSARLAFSFSSRPLRLSGACGGLCAIAGIALAIFVAFYRLLFPDSFPAEAVGWTSLMVVLLLGIGLQLVFLGAVAEYVARSYLLLSNAPQTSISAVVNCHPPDRNGLSSAEQLPINEVRFGSGIGL
jgi:glycosyltransferase involved in cell wall biosynthesis